jgi:hypothetical protein
MKKILLLTTFFGLLWMNMGLAKAQTCSDVVIDLFHCNSDGVGGCYTWSSPGHPYACSWNGNACKTNSGVCSSNDSCSGPPCTFNNGNGCSKADCEIGGGGGGGGSCPSECKSGSSCGAGYSDSNGCSPVCGSGKVCCEANNCGPAQGAACNPGEIQVDHVPGDGVCALNNPECLICILPSGCVSGGDGTGGETGEVIDEQCSDALPSRRRCKLQFCSKGAKNCHYEGCSSCTSHPGYYFSYNPPCSGTTCSLGCDSIWPKWLGEDAPGYVNTNGDQYVRTAACEAGCPSGPPVPANVTIQGAKVIEPGSVSSGVQAGQLVTLNNPGLSTTLQPFSFTFPLAEGTLRTVSVSPLAGYDIGYSLCYNNTTCHVAANVVAGTSAIVSDTSINSSEGSNFYADLNFHYCPYQTAPTSLSVAGMVGGNVCAPNARIIWAPVIGASEYILSVTDLNSGSVNVISGISGAATSYIVTVVAGHNYHAVLESRNICKGGEGVSSSVDFGVVTTPIPPTNVHIADDIQAIKVTWTDSVPNETNFKVYRNPGNVLVATTVANATSYRDIFAICGTVYQYGVASLISTNPPACQESSPAISNADSCAAFTDAWFMGQGGDIVAANGQLNTILPPTVPPYPVPWFLSAGEPPLPVGDTPLGLPGMAFGTSIGSGLNTSNVSSKGWLNTTHVLDNLTAKVENTYSAMHDRLVSRTDAGSAYVLTGANINQGTLDAAVISAVGAGNKLTFNYGFGDFNVVILELGNAGGVNIGPLDVGQNNVIILVDQGVVTINGDLTIDETDPKHAGMLAILSKDDMRVGGATAITPTPAVAPFQYDVTDQTFPANISAILYTQGVFSVNASASQLKINGSVIGMGGVVWARTGLGPYPAEFVHFNPRMTRILKDVGLRRKIIYENTP